MRQVVGALRGGELEQREAVVGEVVVVVVAPTVTTLLVRCPAAS